VQQSRGEGGTDDLGERNRKKRKPLLKKENFEGEAF